MVFIVIRLVGEEKDRLFKDVIVEQKISRVDLKKKIEHVTHIPFEFQQIKLRGQELPNSLLPLESIKNFDEIEVEHISLPQWKALTETVKMFGKLKDLHEKKRHFTLANDYITALMDTKFFVAYAGLNEDYGRLHGTLYKHYDKRPEEIQNTLTDFFGKMFVEKNPIFCFNEKEEGTRDGIICTVKFENIIERYYVKTNHDAGRSGSPSRLELDIREFFIYRLLEKLGVGAAIHFPTSAIGSKCLVYIASLEIPNFKSFHEIEQKEEDLGKYVHPAIQILTLFSVLNIADCHSKNVGVNNDGSPYIIDFFLYKLGIRDLQKDFYANVRGSNQINKRINEYSFEKRVEIGVNFLKKIEIETNIDEAIKYFMEKDKNLFEEDELHFSLNKTDDLNQYVEIVKENVKKFFSYCK